ncbi:MAG: riboflavin synthase [Candidatus Omnitrophica bacterium]|nr:riboflavin synthase [Candidatus Omnitrophota bacterium]
MFSGIVEELGQVKSIYRSGKITTIEIAADKALAQSGIGDSVAVNGACLTIVKKGARSLFFEAMPETLKVSNLGSLRITDKVNLERSLKIGDRLSGHFVGGHIDCVGIIRKKGYTDGNLSFEVATPPGFMDYILPKGAIAVDGISLTIAKKGPCTFFVYIIPHTLKNTTLGFKGPSDKVNIEFDILAKKSLLI